ncbi:MerR family transcriptional regulator [Streptosporangium saharense]|uniref:DNA-binding transcriptional MerR regulator n=1 Tax=Streptosporangium saharense TaxID=1706840 RepID=A0A7W7VLK2_9ACTN|nr:MerR family transcriptional regulator [Streptosporangium saharense]MBB4914489.1 DNA-binding transcriptional MerR regulator [Streptosporangium saharense]
MTDEQGQATAEETGQEPGYGIGAVARRLGVPAPTLRTWNLRYGLGPSRRSPGGHRRYDSTDLRRLEEMNRLLRQGVPAADAARQVLRLPHRAPAPPPVPGKTDKTDEAAIPTVAMLARAATALDSQGVSDWIEAALTRHGVEWTWHTLVLPVFEAICRRQAETGAGIEVEHLFSERLLGALIRVGRPASRPVNDRPVLLACAENEQHSMPVHALAAALALDNVQTRVLGARTPYSALGDAMRRLGPSVVFVWSQIPETGDPAPLASLPPLRPPSRLIVGGEGWWEGLPPPVSRVSSFAEALDRVHAALR